MKLTLASLLLLAACGTDPCAGVSGSCVRFAAGASEASIQKAFATTTGNTTFAFAAGTYAIKSGVNFDTVSGVTIKGAGLTKTTFDFTGQTTGADGISFNGGANVYLHDFGIVNTAGNATRIEGVTGVHLQNVKVNWTTTPNDTHGGYGLYPVQSTNVLIEGCQVSGASDSGVYMGQSQQVVIRNNEVFENVAGIEIENTQHADVYSNNTHDNTAGILVFDLPNLQQYGGFVRIYNNNSHDNNTKNFAVAGDIVGDVPTGMGMFVMANHDVEIFGNTIGNSNTANFAIVSFKILGQPWTDPNYYPYSTRVYVHDNTFGAGGVSPDNSPIGYELQAVKQSVFNGTIPNISYDGFVDSTATGLPGNPMTICITAGTTFANLHADSGDGFADATTDPTDYICSLPALPAVSFPGL